MANVLIVIDMQQGVLATERYRAAEKIVVMNQLIRAADQVIFIRHCEGEMQPGHPSWALVPELYQPENARYVSKTACDSFYQTTLTEELAKATARAFTVCGCATDYCVDTTVKVGASLGYKITVAADAHTTANRRAVTAPQLISQHNDVWAELSLPGNCIQVLPAQQIIAQWSSAVLNPEASESMPAKADPA